MARDVEVDVLMRDKTGPAIKSTEQNLKRVGDQASKVTAQLNKGVAQWGRGLSKLGGAANRWANSGDTAGKKFVRGIGSGVEKLAQLGGKVGGGLSQAVQAAGPQVALAVTAVLASAALAAAPVMASAIVGGAGVGGIVGGVLLASTDARFRSALDALKEEAAGQLQEAAGRFVPATLDAIKKARSAFRGLLPDLRKIFDVSATWLGPLTQSIGRGAQSMVAGIATAVSKAGPIIRVIGEGVERLMDAVGDGFRMLSDNGASMALALKGAFLLVEVALRGTFFVLNVLVEAFEKVASIVPGLSGKLKELESSQDGSKVSAFNLAGGFQALAGDANSAAAGITNLKQKSDEFAEANLSLRDAQIAARDAIKSATATITENGQAKGFNSQKGRENEKALNDLARAFNTEADAGDRSGRSAKEASDAYHNNRLKLIAMAEKAGYSRQKAEELAAQLLKIPKNVTTDVNANTAAASAKVETFQKKIKNLKGKTVYVTVQVTSKGDHRIPGVGTQLKGLSRGGPVMAPGPKGVDSKAYLLARGEHVLTAREVDAAGGHAAIMAWRKRILARDAAPTVAAGPARSLAPAGGGVTVEKLEVRAYSDRFSLGQVLGDLAVYGVR